MNGISGLLGTAGGAAGTGFTAPQMANIQGAVTPEQVQQQYQNAQQGYAQQQALLQALQGAGGIQGQAGALQQQQAFNQALSAQQGLQTQAGAVAGLQNVAGQLGQVAAGGGPNPAQAMLAQSTGANVANQAALMAGQRGANANVGLMARQAAQQGAATQQQAAGQASALQSQQMLNAMQQQAGVQQAIGGLGTTQVGQQQAGLQAQAAQGAQLAGQQAAATGALTGAGQGMYGQTLGGVGALNQANIAATGQINQANTQLAQTTMQGQQKGLGGLFNAVGAGTGLFAKGGPVESFPKIEAPTSFADFISGHSGLQMAKGGNVYDYRTGGHVKAENPSEKAVKHGNSYDNDKIPAMLSEGEVVIPRSVMQSKDPRKGAGDFVAAVLAKRGKK